MASEGETKLDDLAVSVCAVLVAQACNIGLKAVVQLGTPALSLSRLAWVRQNYVRSDTILQANTKLVEAHSKLPIVRRAMHAGRDVGVAVRWPAPMVFALWCQSEVFTQARTRGTSGHNAASRTTR